MAKAKKGDHLSCKVCGLVVVVDEACGCASAEILCCEKPMVKGKPAAKKKPAAKVAKTKAKTSTKATGKAPQAKGKTPKAAKTVARTRQAVKKATGIKMIL